MRFISNGDYIFPFNAVYYWLKQVYMWSYQTGAANPDGIIRMPGRLLDLAVFAVLGNIAISYFYIASSMAIVFVAFYYFARKFLQITNPAVALVGALFFTLNPIYLGNLSKVGLVLAAAMLPLCLAMVQQGFAQHKLRYFLLWVVFLNLSLIHPFTFTVNLLASGVYFVYLAWQDRTFLWRSLGKLALVGGLALLLNAYFILPLGSMGTVSKGVLSSDVTSAPVDYTSLVEVANTGDIFTGLSLSKNVLKDYEFYSSKSENFYFLGVFILYAALLAVYVRTEKRMSAGNKRHFTIFLACFLALILLAAVKFLDVDALIKLLINLPGGWMFRSPLKWQLYIPFVLFAMLTLLLAQVKRRGRRRAIYAGLAVSFVLMNAYICVDIYQKLLMPRTVQYFSALQRMDLDHKNLLIVGNDQCFSFASGNPEVMTELNQILISKNTQVKQVSMGDLDHINLASYDYVLGCQDTMQQTFASSYNFKETQNFVDDAFQLYANQKARPYLYAAPNVYALTGTSPQPGNKYNFASSVLHQSFDFVDTSRATPPDVGGMQDAFEDLSFNNLQNGKVVTTLPPAHSGRQTLYIKDTKTPLYYKQNGNQILLSPNAQAGYEGVKTSGDVAQISINATQGQPLTFSYADSKYQHKNLIANGSLEQGMWQKKVGDCYAYDNEPQIGMSLNASSKTDGKQSLQLQSQNHIACTGPNKISVQPGQNYLLSFDYQNVGGQYAGYYIGFNDADSTFMSDRLTSPSNKGGWQTFTKDLVVPAGAHSMQLLVYAYPDGSGVTPGIARYDNFQMAAVPDIQDHFYVVSQPAQQLQAPASVTYQVVNPTKNTVQIRGATTPFYLASQESFSGQWRLELNDRAASLFWPLAHVTAVPNKNHVQMNGNMNGWYVDPAQLCARASAACTRSADGSYAISLVMEFTPQRWFVLGTAISGVAVLVTLGYFAYDIRLDHTVRRYWRWRR